MTVRCASCGWGVTTGNRTATDVGARHLRTCPRRDDITMLPWWTTVTATFEVGWHPRDINEPTWMPDANGDGYSRSPVRRYRFTEYAEREIIRVRTVRPITARLAHAIATALEEADASHDDNIFAVRLINLCGLSFGGDYRASAAEIRRLVDA